MRGAGAITVGSKANVQVTAFFTNGATRAFDFIDHDGGGGGHANILIGGSEAGWGAWVKALGSRGASFINFSLNPMTRLPYTKKNDILDGHLRKGLAMRIEPEVSTKIPITFINPRIYGRKDVEYGIELHGGDLLIKQGNIGEYQKKPLVLDGGRVELRNTNITGTFK
jgi:hypothetical protein